MKHWDLTPGQSVVLKRGGRAIQAVFRFRSTTFATFETFEGPRPRLIDFELLKDGALCDPPLYVEALKDLIHFRDRVWSISEPVLFAKGASA